MTFNQKILLIYKEIINIENRKGELKQILNKLEIPYTQDDLFEYRDYFKKSKHFKIFDLPKSMLSLTLNQKGLDFIEKQETIEKVIGVLPTYREKIEAEITIKDSNKYGVKNNILCPFCDEAIFTKSSGIIICQNCGRKTYKRYKAWEKDTSEKILIKIEKVDENAPLKKLLKKDFKILIGNNKLLECSEKLIEYFYSMETINQNNINEAIHLKSRLIRLKDQIMKGVIENSKSNILMNQISNGFLYLIDEI